MAIQVSGYIGPAVGRTVNQQDGSITLQFEATLPAEILSFGITIQPGDNQQTILNKLGTACRAEATKRGYTVPVNWLVIEDAYTRA